MTDIKNKKHILATIDQLRSRKSRPDVNRICKYMLTYYKISPKDTKADLRRCVKEKSVLKVDYKDNVSYRNAENWKKDKRRTHNKKMAASESSERRVITTAIASLFYQEQNYIEHGLSFDLLLKTAVDFTDKYTTEQLETIIKREIDAGSLIKLPNGKLTLGPIDSMDGDSCDSIKFDSNTKTSSGNSSAQSSPMRRGRPRKRGAGALSNQDSARNSGVRVGERRKMAKKVFDPSDIIIPSKRKRGRPAGSLNKSTLKKLTDTPRSQSQPRSEGLNSNDASSDEAEPGTGGVCSVCLVLKAKGSNDRMVECVECNTKAHLSCIQNGPPILKLNSNNTWHCPHCKTCVVCIETNDAGVLTVCSVCHDPYHALCHTPRIPEGKKAWDQWICNICVQNHLRLKLISPSLILSKDSSKEDPFLKPHEIERSQSKLPEELPIDTNIPDISSWTSNDVYEYFMEHCPDAAPILKEQEMDGPALSLAGRTDIVKGLGLPLGPALALYRIVVKLQTRKDDWTMCWG